MKDKKHLPLIGVGPVIVVPQLVLTAAGIIFFALGKINAGKIPVLKIPFAIIGIMLILSGIYLWYCANYKDKVFDCITYNKLEPVDTILAK